MGEVVEADVIVLDAFSSDAIPVHLLTREAFEMYRRKLKAGGWLVVHVSSRYLDLGPVPGALARDPGMVGRLREDDSPKAPGQEASHWAVLASDEAGLGMLAKKAAWHPLEVRSGVSAWTDQRASIWPVFRWGTWKRRPRGGPACGIPPPGGRRRHRPP